MWLVTVIVRSVGVVPAAVPAAGIGISPSFVVCQTHRGGGVNKTYHIHQPIDVGLYVNLPPTDINELRMACVDYRSMWSMSIVVIKIY
jgi:hypothetical protein